MINDNVAGRWIIIVYCDPPQFVYNFVIMHQTAAEPASVDETRQDIKNEASATGIVSTIMEKYTLADPWPAKNEKVPSTPDTADTCQILTDPYRYLHAKPGKDIRSLMIASFNNWLQVPEIALQIITQVVEMLHTSSLL